MSDVTRHHATGAIVPREELLTDLVECLDRAHAMRARGTTPPAHLLDRIERLKFTLGLSSHAPARR